MKKYKIILLSSILPVMLFTSCKSEDDSFNTVSKSTYLDTIFNFREIKPSFSKLNELEATFKPIAANAVKFDVFFGDVEDEVPTTVKIGDSVVHEYQERGTYDVKFIAESLSGDTDEASARISIGLTAPYVEQFDEIDGFFGFGVDIAIVNNPFKQGTNLNDTKVFQFEKGPGGFQGAGFDQGEIIIDFIGENKKVDIKVYSTKAVPIALIFQNGVNVSRGVEANGNHTGSGWETITLDYAKAKLEFVGGATDNGAPIIATDQYKKFVLFIDGPSADPGSFFVDDIIQESL